MSLEDQRVLVLSDDLPPHAASGIGSAVAAQVAGLRAAGWRTEVWTPCTPADVEGPTYPLSRPPLAPGRRDLVHLHSLGLATLALDLRERFGCRLVYSAHTHVATEIGDGPWADLQRLLVRTADAVIFPSAAERGRWEPSPRTHVVPHGLLPAQRGASSGEILFPSRFTRAKGCALTARLAPRLARRHPVRVLGGADPESATLLGSLHGTGVVVEPRVSCAEALDRISRASLVVVPSRYEPFGMVALEARARGVPVLAADVDGLREVVDDPGVGERLRGEDPARWERAAGQLVAQPPKPAGLGRFHRAQTTSALATVYTGLEAAWPPSSS